ncbi:SGNH/GDSL hydrolase family protein [Kribbella sp. NPDC003557]|uniref:SGNH/GDSL hydrolase family protein n=1 Tax=Kribbella sp. NPDC003557 TaxID=3154449 RepID=UPI0033BDD4E7
MSTKPVDFEQLIVPTTSQCICRPHRSVRRARGRFDARTGRATGGDMADSGSAQEATAPSARSAARDKRVWIPLSIGVLILVGSKFVGGDVPAVVYVAAGVGLIVWGLLRLLGTIDEQSKHSRDIWLAMAVWLGGFVLIGIWLLLDVDGLGVVGSVAGYVAFGHLLLAARASTCGAPWRGPVALAICVASFVVGWLVMMPSKDPGAWWPWVPLILLGGSLVAAPVGVSLFSADVLRHPGVMARRDRNIRIFTVVGLLVLGILTVLLLQQLGQIYRPVLVLGVAGFFLLGLIAARTQADTVLVAGLLLVMAVIAAHPTPAPPAPSAGRMIVALGDSYMSGEGAGSFFQGTDDAGANECRRAPTAYPFVYAENLGAAKYPGGVVSFACSGARTSHLNLPAASGIPQYSGEPVDGSAGQTQFQQLESLLDSGADVDLVLLSIGGNDSGFATIGTTCLAPGHCDELEKLWTGNLGNVRQAIRTTYAALKSILEQRNLRTPVLVVPYPDPIAERRCPDLALAKTEIDFLHRFINQLDTVIREEAATAKFLYLDTMPTTFVANKLRLCDHGPKTGVNFLNAQSVNGSVEAQVYPKNWVHNSLHPNEDGHEQMAATLAAWLTAHPPRDQTYAETPAVTPPEATPPCGLAELDVEKTGKRCDREAQHWALLRIKDRMLPSVWLIGILAAGAWLLWIAELGRYRNGTGILHGIHNRLQRFRGTPAKPEATPPKVP